MKNPVQLLGAAALLSAGFVVPALAANGGSDPNYWVPVGHERFQGLSDRESAFAGWAGRSVDRIGLRANKFARCTRVRAQFGNGRVRDLDTGNLMRMEPGRVYRVDLPGGDRRIVKLNLRCHALGRYAVNVDIFARK